RAGRAARVNRKSGQVADHVTDLHNNRYEASGDAVRDREADDVPGGDPLRSRKARIEPIAAQAAAGRNDGRRLDPDIDLDSRGRNVGDAALRFVACDRAQARAVDEHVLSGLHALTNAVRSRAPVGGGY